MLLALLKWLLLGTENDCRPEGGEWRHGPDGPWSPRWAEPGDTNRNSHTGNASSLLHRDGVQVRIGSPSMAPLNRKINFILYCFFIYPWHVGHGGLGCPRNKQKYISVRTETNRKKICFTFVSVCFVKPKTKNFGLFRCFEPKSKQPKQTELFRNKPKQTETTLNFLKNTQTYSLPFYGFYWIKIHSYNIAKYINHNFLIVLFL